MAAKNTYSFAQNPANGGIPAMENIDIPMVNPINGFSLCRFPSSSIYLIGPPERPDSFGVFEVERTIVQMFKLITI